MNEPKYAFEIGVDQLGQLLSKASSFQLINAQNYGQDSKLFIVDCRSFINYNNCHVRGAVNAFYSKLMRKRLIKKTTSTDFILNHISLSGGNENVELVLYGSNKWLPSHMEAECARKRRNKKEHKTSSTNKANAKNETRSSTLAPNEHEDIDETNDAPFVRHLFDVLRDPMRFQFRRVMLLSDGFDEFAERYPTYCESSEQQQRRVQRDIGEDPAADNRLGKLFSMDRARRSESRENDTPPSSALERKLLNNFKGSFWYTKPAAFEAEDGPSKIFEYLYLGNIENAKDEKVLKNNHITCLISICESAFLPACIKNDDTHFKQICVKDTMDTKLRPFYDEVIHFIDNARKMGEKVLVHCQAGISRSPSLVIAYVMQNRRFSFDKAYEFVRCQRSKIEPNFGFISELRRFADELGHQTETGDRVEMNEDNSANQSEFNAETQIPKLCNNSTVTNASASAPCIQLGETRKRSKNLSADEIETPFTYLKQQKKFVSDSLAKSPASAILKLNISSKNKSTCETDPK